MTVEDLRRWASGAENRRDASAIVVAARAQPDTLRAALVRTFALAATSPDGSVRAGELAAARRLAEAYGVAWDDSFFVRRVASFQRWSPEVRRASVAADSLRRAGIAVYGREGVPAARALWREALRRVPGVDRAGRAAALTSVGAGFYLAGELDSASVYLRSGRDLASRAGDLRTLGNAIGVLASVREAEGDLAAAAGLYAEASAIRERTGDRRGIAADQNNLALIARELGDLAEARRALERALALNRRDGRPREVALNLANLADIASVVGDYARAETLYRDALAINREAGDRSESAFVLRDLGLLAMRRGDYTEARSRLRAALAIHEETGAAVSAIEVRRDLAALRAAMGDLQAAISSLQRAEAEAAAVAGGPALRATLALTRADLAVQLGQLAEAEAEYVRAERLSRIAEDETRRAEAQEGRGLLLFLREDFAGALRLLELAARGHGRAGDARAAALTQRLIGHVQGEAGDTTEARRTLAHANERLQALGDPVAEGAGLVARGDLAARTGATLAAESFYRRGLERLGARPAVDVRWQLRAGLGEALRARGALEPAARELAAAVAALEEVAGGLRLEERRVGFLADKWEVYASLALVEQARGRPAAAFAASERLRARQLRDLLARGRIPARREVTAKEQDLRRRITALTRALEGRGSDRPGSREAPLTRESLDATREALAASQRAYAELLREIRERDPAYAELVSGEPASWRAVADRLKPDEALLEYLVSDSTSTVFVVTTDTVATLELDLGRRGLSNLVTFARRTTERPDGSPASSLWRTPLRRLAQYLIDPVERAGFLEGRRGLVIVPHGELHFLPFGALILAGPAEGFLVERFELAYAPSASVWLRLGSRARARESGRVLALAPRTETLPGSREEAAAIGQIYGRRATVLIGADASERALRSAAPAQSVLHLATYGILNKHNPLFSFVELASTEGDDGRLEVHEVFGLDLADPLVVLSACQTALASGAISDVPPGDDWVGLVQAFLYAGARSVLASLWPVEDRATARLMARFYRSLAAGRSETRALIEAQRALLRDPATGHPFYWAGFILTGAATRD